jgi:S1-C subfamily serine protease
MKYPHRSLSALCLAFAVSVAHAESPPPAVEAARQQVKAARQQLFSALEAQSEAERAAGLNTPATFATELMKNPKRGVLGILFEPDLTAGGLKIAALPPRGAGNEAGLQVGDVVLSLNGQAATPTMLLGFSRSLEVGQRVKVIYLRQGQRAESTLTAERPRHLERMEGRMEGGKAHGRHGMDGLPPRHPHFFAAMNAGLAAYFKVSEGLLVLEVPPMDTLGLKVGDVIQSLNGQALKQPMDLREALKDLPKNSKITANVVREGRSLGLTGTVPDFAGKFKGKMSGWLPS